MSYTHLICCLYHSFVRSQFPRATLVHIWKSPLLFVCLSVACYYFVFIHTVKCVYIFFSTLISFSSPSCTTDQGLITVSKYPVSIAFSQECRHDGSRWFYMRTGVMLFINSTFHGNCQLETEKKIILQLTFVHSFTPKLVVHSLWHRRRM